MYGTYIITKIVDTKSFIRYRHSYDIDIYTIFYILKQYLQISLSCSNRRGTIQNFVVFVIFQSLSCAQLFLDYSPPGSSVLHYLPVLEAYIRVYVCVVLAQLAITKHSWVTQIAAIYFSQFWRQEVHDQGVAGVES